jgi:hypothetical protein
MSKIINIVLTAAFLLSLLFLSSCSGGGYGSRPHASYQMGVGYNHYYGRPWGGGYDSGYIDGIEDGVEDGIDIEDRPIETPLPATGMPDMDGGDMGMGMDMGDIDF